MYRIRGVNFLHEEMNSISNMLSFRSSMNVICTCCVGEICMNKILFKPIYFYLFVYCRHNLQEFKHSLNGICPIVQSSTYLSVCYLWRQLIARDTFFFNRLFR